MGPGGNDTPCGLSNDQLDLLYYLLNRRCLSEKHSVRLEVIEDAFREKMDVQKILNGLTLVGYVVSKKKKSANYWAIPGRTISALEHHGYPIPRGGRVRL